MFSSSNRTGSAQRGFTLIELLVVIAIIAILAAILFPVFAQARAKARQIADLSNAKQIGTALTMYMQDYDEVCVPWYVLSGIPRDTARRDLNSWVHLLQPYIKSGEPQRILNPVGVKATGMMADPGFTESRFWATAARADCDGAGILAWSPPRHYWANYGIGLGIRRTAAAFCGTNTDPYYYFAGSNVGSGLFMTLASVNRPAESAIVTNGFTGIIPSGGVGTTMGCEAADSHTGGGNIVYLDGHAKWLKGNIERYYDTDPQGCVFEKYLSIDK